MHSCNAARPVHQARALIVVLLMSVVTTGTPAEGPHTANDRLRDDLSLLNLADAVINSGSFCSRRFPSTGPLWNRAIAAFQTRNRSQLAELKVTQQQFLDELQQVTPDGTEADAEIRASAEDWKQQSSLEIRKMELVDDEHARDGCDSMREIFGKITIDESQVTFARESASAAIDRLKHH